MKLKVEKQFRDKVTGQLHKVNDVFSVDDERGAELLNHPMGLVSVSKEAEEKPKKTAPKTKTASKKSKKSE
jgi:acetolactate synthase small subunit